MLGGYTIGYLYYAITLYIVSGLLIIYIDARDLGKDKKKKKEWKISRFIGWFNIAAGVLMWVWDIVID
ncbi:CLC_0170 family protein [Paenibacillus glycanilyticus]|uniref:CLC_0170 family protein n=1 Tax=Paenibacillus glycanilyticus TaxID=126569 RepID=UPI003EBDB9E1